MHAKWSKKQLSHKTWNILHLHKQYKTGCLHSHGRGLWMYLPRIPAINLFEPIRLQYSHDVIRYEIFEAVINVHHRAVSANNRAILSYSKPVINLQQDKISTTHSCSPNKRGQYRARWVGGLDSIVCCCRLDLEGVYISLGCSNTLELACSCMCILNEYSFYITQWHFCIPKIYYSNQIYDVITQCNILSPT